MESNWEIARAGSHRVESGELVKDRLGHPYAPRGGDWVVKVFAMHPPQPGEAYGRTDTWTMVVDSVARKITWYDIELGEQPPEVGDR